MKYNSILTPIALFSLMAVLSVSCSDDEDYAEEKTVPLNLCSSANATFTDGSDQGTRVMTRAYTDADLFVPGTGSSDDVSKVAKYLPYSKLYPMPINSDYTTIGAFLAQNTQDSYSSLAGFFKWEKDNSWSTTVGIKPGDFFIFGYMPSNVGSVSASIAKSTGAGTPNSWSDGCVMTINNLSTVTPADVCVVVGVKRAPDGFNSASPWGIDDKDYVVPVLRQGQYAYQGTETDNYVYLLLDHLYTNVNLELSVEQKYAQLRSIVLTEVFMKTSVRNTVNATVTLTNSRTKPIGNIQYDAPTGGTPTNAQIFPAEPQFQQVVAVEGSGVTSVPGYFAPGLTTQDFEFEFHYDVYDKDGEDLSNPKNPVFGNCVRKNCVAINKWKLDGDKVGPGKSFKVTATVRPTYLFQLSEPDLDNPTITLNSVTN